MRLLDAWASMPEPERTAKLRLLRSVAWTVPGQGGHRVAIACRCAEAGIAGSLDAADELLATNIDLAELAVRVGEASWRGRAVEKSTALGTRSAGATTRTTFDERPIYGGNNA